MCSFRFARNGSQIVELPPSRALVETVNPAGTRPEPQRQALIARATPTWLRQVFRLRATTQALPAKCLAGLPIRTPVRELDSGDLARFGLTRVRASLRASRYGGASAAAFHRLPLWARHDLHGTGTATDAKYIAGDSRLPGSDVALTLLQGSATFIVRGGGPISAYAR